MKTIISTRFLAALLIGLAPYFTVAQTSEPSLNGTWNIDVDQSINLMDDDRQGLYDALSQEEQNQQRVQYESQQFSFLDANVFEVNFNGTTQSAEWMRVEPNKVRLSFSNGASITHTIISISEEELILQVAEASSSTLFYQLFLVRTSE